MAKAALTKTKMVEAVRLTPLKVSKPTTTALVKQSNVLALELLAPQSPDLALKAAAIIQALNEFKIEPMRDRVLVLRADPNKMYGGLIIPDIAQETQGVGIVVGVGTGHYEHGVITPLEVKLQQVVLFSKYGGIPIKLPGMNIELLQLREEEIQTKAG